MIKNSIKITKKFAAFLSAAILLITSIPTYAAATNAENTKTIRIDASAIATGGERFAAYLFNGSESSKFVDMKADGKNFTADIPASYSQIIFCRMNGATRENNWNNCWNQTYDLSTNEGNTYTVSGWGSGNKMNGYWKTVKSETEETDYMPAYYESVVGSFNNWDCTKNLTQPNYRGGQAEVYLTPGSYEFKFVTVYTNGNKIWTGADNATISGSDPKSVNATNPGNNIKLNITEAGTYYFYHRVDTQKISVGKVYKEEEATQPATEPAAQADKAPASVGSSAPADDEFVYSYYESVVGTFNDWDYTKNVIHTNYRGGQDEIFLTPGVYEFKFVIVSNDNSKLWLGADNANITVTSSKSVKASTTGSNIKLTITEAGTYYFYHRVDTQTITVGRYNY